MSSAKPVATAEKNAPNEGRMYLESLVNAGNQRNTWRSIAMLELVLIAVMLWALVQTTRSLPVRLITYEMATGNVAMEVGPNGEGAKEYLGFIAEADLKLFTDWIPDTVDKRFKGLARRMTAELHAEQYVQLEREAENFKKARYHQVFHTKNKQAIGNDTIRIDGILVRYAGEQIVLDQAISYILEYSWTGGQPALRSIYPLEKGVNPANPQPKPETES